MISPYIFPGIKQGFLPKNLIKNTIRKNMGDSELYEIIYDTFTINKEQILAKKRGNNISPVRDLVFYILYKKYKKSNSEIAREFRRKSHASIIYGINKFKELYIKDYEFKKSSDFVLSRIGMKIGIDEIINE